VNTSQSQASFVQTIGAVILLVVFSAFFIAVAFYGLHLFLPFLRFFLLSLFLSVLLIHRSGVRVVTLFKGCGSTRLRTSCNTLFLPGCEVKLSHNFASYSDAKRGPLKPGDIGTLIGWSRERGASRFKVQFGKKTWSYDESALSPAQALQKGSCVRMAGLKAQAALWLNGRTGVICSAFDAGRGRWTVEIDGTDPPHKVSVLPTNLTLIRAAVCAADHR
jgi:hypothetical protein